MKTTLLFISVFLTTSLFGQNVYIPDAIFKAYLVGIPIINTNGDTEIQVTEASSYNSYIDCSETGPDGISDLTGIEAFTALTGLNCDGNALTSLDVSQNTALTLLYCGYNQLTSLDVSQNTDLWALECGENQLTSLDVTQNTALERFGCSYNQLTSLDVSQQSALTEFSCRNNPLTCLNVANGNNTYLTYFRAWNNPNLTCIEVDDANWSTINWTNWIDPQTSFSEDCNNDCTSNLNELTTTKTLIQILDLMGRETVFKPNTPLIYVYDDGSTEKVFSVKY